MTRGARANARQYLAGRYAAQEARRAGIARADDHAYAHTEGARFQSGAEIVDTHTREVEPGALPLAPGQRETPRGPGVAPQLTFLPLRELAFELPFPPSVNEAWHHVPQRGATRREDRVHIALTEAHRRFRTLVIAAVHRHMLRTEQRAQPLLGRIELTLRLYFANRRRADVDNRIKPLQDALTHAGAYRDDSQIDRLVVERLIVGNEERCEVVLREIAA